MKETTRYYRIKVARKEWQERLGIEDKVKAEKCTKAEVEELLKSYKNWVIVENTHCCYGWRRCCWQELIEENILGMTKSSVKENVKRNLEDVINISKKYPVFYVYKKDKDTVEILITYRYNKNKDRVDLYITGTNEALYENRQG